jgi:hypothetical protein
MKHDAGKAPVGRGFMSYFPRAIKRVALVSQFGFEKYKEWGGWRKVDDAFNRYDDALLRHDVEHRTGQLTDHESKLRHLEHRAWNAMATLELFLTEQEAKDRSWAEAKIEDDKLALKQWRADKFTTLHTDAMARMYGKNTAGSDRRETTDEPLRTCRDCKCWSACSRMGQCIGAEATHD